MRLIIPLLLTCVVTFSQLSIASDAPPAPSTQPDLSTPLSAVVTFLKESSDTDEEKARHTAVLDDGTARLLDATFSADRYHKLFVSAAVTRFGDPAKAKLDVDAYAFLI
jgi:hypothetical protein